jgi:hypothetical protein
MCTMHVLNNYMHKFGTSNTSYILYGLFGRFKVCSHDTYILVLSFLYQGTGHFYVCNT